MKPVYLLSALTVEEAYLVVQPVVSVLGFDKIALQLHTEVAARTFMFAVAVVNRSEFHRGLRVTA